MFLFATRYLQEAVLQGDQTCKDLYRAYDKIMDAAINIGKWDDRTLAFQLVTSTEKCREQMRAEIDTLREILARREESSLIKHRAPNFILQRDEVPYNGLQTYQCRYLREAADESKYACEGLNTTYVLLSKSLSILHRRDNDQIKNSIERIRECERQMLIVNETLAELYERVEKVELEALYAPPSYFEKANEPST